MTADPFAGARSVLFAHAHPDDETLSSGGVILRLVERGVRVTLLTATRGERGDVVPELKERIRGDPEVLTVIRLDELRRAVRALGIADVYFLGEPPARAAGLPPRRYSDSGMRWVTPAVAGPVDDAPAEALTRASEAEVVADVIALIRHVRPDVVVSYDDQGGYGHPDHRCIRGAALLASRAAGVPFAELVAADAPRSFLIDASDRLDGIAEALRAHATQLTVHGDHVVHSGGQREPIMTVVGVRVVSDTLADRTERALPPNT